MLQVSNLEKQYGEQVLFDGATLTIAPGERVALFGRNGSGKSTLLKILAGEESADGGDVSTPRGYKIGYLKQHLSFSQPTVLEEACLALTGDPVCEQYKAEIVLSGLGFSESDYYLSPTALSGGFQIRINLAKLILSEPNMLLLDEPTNYLDIVSLRWLERYLQQWPGEMIVISHDRYFCDQVSTHSALLYRSGFRKIEGDSQKLFERISEDEALYERTRLNREKEIKRMESFINRFKAQASKATLVQSRVKALARMGSMEELSSEANLEFSFVYQQFPGRFPIEIEGISFGYDPAIKPLVRDLSITIKKDDRIGIIGKNGRGKSTLLRLIAGEEKPQCGEMVLSPNTSMAYFAQTNTNRLALSATIEQEVASANPALGRTAVRAICGCMMFEGDDALKKVSVLSGGERSRVLLGKIVATPCNLLLLDEPTNHLDIESVSALTDALEDFEGAVLIVTHSEQMLRRLAKRLIVFQGDQPFVYEGTYDEFLDDIGWDEEEEQFGGPSKRKKNRAGSEKVAPKSKEEKRERAAAVQERSKVINPARERVGVLEKSIAALESEIAEAQVVLAKASAEGDANKIRSASHSLASAQRNLEGRMSEWEAAQATLEELEKQYGVAADVT
jgi:ATP-binding cassette subfamily F protein 3